MGKSSSVTVGHKVYLGGQLVFCHGPIDSIDTIEWDTRAGWRGLATGGTITVDAEHLFGGAKEPSTTPGFGGGDNSDADGVSGEIDILMGGPTQTQNSYLQSILGELIPASRGVVSFVLKQLYVGNSPSLRPLAAWGTRIHVKDDGQPQWYDEKAAIPYKHVNFEYDGLWKYKVVAPSGAGAPGLPAIYIIPSYDDSGWSEGSGGFGNVAPPGSTLAANTFVSSGTVGKAIWIRKKIVINKLGSTNLELDLYHDDGVWVWWNGEAIPTVQQVNYFHSKASIPNDKILASNVLVVQVLDGIPGGVATDIFAGVAIRDTGTAFSDINPAHFLRECYTSTVWGLKRPEYEMNDASFTAAADQLFDEGMGISLLWDRQQPINELIEEIKRHINADIYIDNEGLVTLKLIRDDYVYDDLPVYDESNIIRVERIASTPERELINAVTVVYWDATTGKDASVQIPHAALVQMTGRINPTTVRYDFFTNADIAIKKGEYDLRVITSSLQTYQVVTNRSSEELNIGDRFILNRPALGAHNMVVRIIDIDLGNGVNNEISLTVTQEVFSLPSLPVMATSPDAVWENPVQPAAPAPARLVFEQPYYELVQYQGQTEVDALLTADDTLAMLGVAAIRPSGTSLDAQVIVDDGAGYHEASVLDYCPSALLATAMNYTTKNITFTDEIDLDLVSIGTHCQIDDELLVVEALDLVARTATLGRGVLDTVPAKEHLIGARIWFWDYYSASDSVTYSDGENVDVKILTNSSLGLLPTSSAPVNSIEFESRAARPYPPGKLLINGSAYPTTIGATDGLSLAWAHRDRLLQTAGTLQDTTVGDIGPEPGTTYRLRIYNQFMSLLRTVSAIAGNVYDYATATEAADSGAGSSGIEEPYWKQTKLLLNFNGANNSATFLDSSGEYADVFGNAKISTTQSKFGGASGYFDGNGDYIELYGSYNIAGSDFTVEMWVFPVSTPAKTQPLIQFVDGTFNGLHIHRNPSGYLIVDNGSVGTTPGTISIPLNTWTHIAVVRSGSTITGYVDGAVALTHTAQSYGTPIRVQLARYGTATGTGDINTSLYNGYIDDVRVTKAARYPSVFTPPTQQFSHRIKDSNFADNKLLLIFEHDDNSGAIRDSSDLNLQVSNFGTTRLETDQSKFGSSSLILERSVSNADFIWVPFNSEHAGVSDITIDAWIRPIETVGTWLHTIASRGLPATSSRIGWNFYIDTDGKLVLTCYDSAGSASVYIKGSTVISINTWHHVAFCKSGTTWYLFLNGVSQGSVTESAAISVGGQELCIGRDQFAGASGDFYGYIDEFRIRSGAHYTSGFSVPTVSAYPEDAYWANTPLLMNFNAANNSTEFENTGNINKVAVVVGNAKLSTTQFKYGVSAGYFDGTGDMVRFPHVDGRYALLADFTIECWVKATAGGSARYIALKASSASVTFPHWALVMGPTGLIECQLGRAQIPQSANFVTSTTAITFGEWVHIAFVRVGSVLKLFLNGTQTGGDVNVTITPLDSGSTGVDIGSYLGADPSLSWLGYIDDLRITKAARYTSNFTPPARELSRYLPALNSQLTFELESERDGLVSYQKHRCTVTRAA